jgi:predicted nucleotidyltransferase
MVTPKEWPGGWLPIPYAQRCRERKADLAQRLATFLAYCRDRPDITAVIVFGSYARDSVSPWSDIDVLVVRDAPADSRSIDLVDDLYRSGGLGGDIVAVASAHYPRGLEATPFGKTILAEGVVVYARSA